MRENYLLDQMLADSINGSVVLLSNLHPFSRSDCPSMNLKCNTDECEIDFGIPTRTNCLEGGPPTKPVQPVHIEIQQNAVQFQLGLLSGGGAGQ